MSERTERIVAMLERLGRLIANAGHAAELKPVQWEALRYLERANRFSRTPTALTEFLGSTKGTVSQTLIALERRGLVRKRPRPEDGRAVTVELTAKARRLLAADPLLELRGSVAEMSESGRRQLESGLDRLLAARLGATGHRPFGICRSCRHFQRDSPDGAPHRCGLLELPLTEDESEKICVEQVS